VYYWLYRREGTRFAFNADILKRQSDMVEQASEASLVRLRTAQEVIQELGDQLDQGTEPARVRHCASVALPSGYKCEMKLIITPSRLKTQPSNVCFFRIVDREGATIVSIQAPPRNSLVQWREKRSDWQEAIPFLSAYVEKEIQRNTLRLASIGTAGADVWSYWDFFYFSTIVQTTAGFGDILPNSTMVRMIVAIQIIIGYALLVVVLNIVLGS
jgi:hypothetical protein